MMASQLWVPDGLYRLVKWQEDGIPAFPANDTVVEVKDGDVINLSTGRSWPLAAMGTERSLFGPLATPYDCTRLRHLKRIDLVRTSKAARQVKAPPM